MSKIAFSTRSSLLILQLFVATAKLLRLVRADANPTLEGYTIEQTSNVYNTELPNDFGFPLTQSNAESLWVEAKEHQWSTMKQRPEELFPFLVCNSQPNSSAYVQLQAVSRLLERAANTTGFSVAYYNPYSAGGSKKGSRSTTKVAIEPVRTGGTTSCFLTSMSYTTALQAANDNESRYMVFNPLTQSMKMIRGTVDTIESVLAAAYSDVSSPTLLLQGCPHVFEDYGADDLGQDIATYMQNPNAPPLGYVTGANFFHEKVANKEGGEALSERFTFWSENLNNGVENSSSNNCKSLLDRVKIKKDSTKGFGLDVNMTGASDTEVACFWSVMAAIGEMPSICLLEVRFPSQLVSINNGSGPIRKMSESPLRGSTVGATTSGASNSFKPSLVASFVALSSLSAFVLSRFR